MKILFRVSITLFSLFSAINSVLAQNWTMTMAPSNRWYCVASSADGTKLIAAGSLGPIYTSTNSGTAWTSNNLPEQDWLGVASSADGRMFVAVNVDNTLIYTSTNFGMNWTSKDVPDAPGYTQHGHTCAACSADGRKIFVGGNVLDISTNSGLTWTTNNITLSYIASSADGNKLVGSYGGPYGDYIFVSTNAGTTWTQTFSTSGGVFNVYLASSADGNKLSAINGGSTIYVSTNSGISWNSNTVPNEHFLAIASSADGNKLGAINQIIVNHQPLYQIFISTNSGLTWTTNNAPATPLWALASSADGNKLITVGSPSSDGLIYTLSSTPSPQLNLISSNNNFIFSWPVPSTNFVLQQHLNLATPNWITLTNTPTLNFTNLQNEVLLTPSNSSGFFRLISQ